MDLLAMFVIGLLGSGHCIGMCGGFAMTIGAVRPSFGPGIAHQLVYSAGRLFTYGFLGALAGLIGGRLAQSNIPLLGAQRGLAILAGLVMLYIGLSSLGVFRWRALNSPAGGGMLGGMLSHFLNARGIGPFLLAGVFTGFLPCGLVYAALAKSMTTTDPLSGWLSMVCFGAGTVPAMVLIGCGSTMLSRTLRTRVLQLAACFVILLGGATLYRGLPFKNGHCHSAASGHSAPSGEGGSPAGQCCDPPS